VKRRVLDVSGLPTMAFGSRDSLWWGVLLAIAIEATMLVLLVIAYFYIADRTTPFPPAHISRSLAWLATADLACWLLACLPQYLSSKAAVRGDLRAMRRLLLVATAITLVGVGLRFWVFRQLPFAWDSHAYGSAVWSLLGLQLFHGITAMGEDAVYCVLLFVGPVEDKHRVDIEVSSPLAYFTAAGALLVWAVVFAQFLFGGAR
jgi:cytochrome c oxidase subunit 3